MNKSFAVTGIDYTGEILVKRGGNIVKAYVVLFTCAVTRAVHLEVVYSLTEQEFLDAFIKFSSRRSYPKIVFTDNASYFKSASKTLSFVTQNDILSNTTMPL